MYKSINDKPYEQMDVQELLKELNGLKNALRPIQEEMSHWNSEWLIGDDCYRSFCVAEYENLEYECTNLQILINDVLSLLQKNRICEETHPELLEISINRTNQNVGLQPIPYRIGSKWGFSDQYKNIIIECKFDEVKRFHNGLAAVRIKKEWSYIDESGNNLYPYIFDGAISFKSDYGVVLFMGHAYKINRKRELLLIERLPGYEWRFMNDKYFQLNENEGTVTITNVNVNPINFKLALSLSELNEEDETISFDTIFLNNEIKPFVHDYKFGFISSEGTIIIPPIYDDGYEFEGDLALVHINNQWGYINKLGIQYWENTN